MGLQESKMFGGAFASTYVKDPLSGVVSTVPCFREEKTDGINAVGDWKVQDEILIT